MPNSIIKISDYSPKPGDVFFFDNNIWMYIFCPLANFQKEKKQRVYSSFFSHLLSRNLHIYTNALVLSEFANRYLRLDFDLVRKDPKADLRYSDFKRDFVGSDRYNATVADVKKYMLQIVNVCQRCSDEFNSINISDVFSLFCNIGFNDSYYINLASTKKWKIVSDDSDFTKRQLPDKSLVILTS